MSTNIRKKIAVYLSEEEIALVEEAAWRRKLKRAEFIRHATLVKAERIVSGEKKA